MTNLREAKKHFTECLIMLEWDESATDINAYCEDELETLTNEAFWELVEVLQAENPDWIYNSFENYWSISLEYGKVGEIWLEGGDCGEKTLQWIANQFGFTAGYHSLYVR